VSRAEQLASLATGPYLAACSLLVIAGIAKLRSRRAILGAAEIAVGAAGAAVGGVAALVVAAAYALLAAYVVHLLRTAPGTPCDCLGAASAPVTGAHLAVNVAACASAATAAFGVPPASELADQPLAALPFLGLVVCCAWLAALVLGAHADLRASSGGHR